MFSFLRIHSVHTSIKCMIGPESLPKVVVDLSIDLDIPGMASSNILSETAGRCTGLSSAQSTLSANSLSIAEVKIRL